jgi:hypothetical protein
LRAFPSRLGTETAGSAQCVVAVCRFKRHPLGCQASGAQDDTRRRPLARRRRRRLARRSRKALLPGPSRNGETRTSDSRTRHSTRGCTNLVAAKPVDVIGPSQGAGTGAAATSGANAGDVVGVGRAVGGVLKDPSRRVVRTVTSTVEPRSDVTLCACSDAA